MSTETNFSSAATNKFRRIIIFGFLLIGIAFAGVSQNLNDNDSARKETLFKELRNYKHRHLCKSLSLSKEQEKTFFPLYDKMEDETNKLNDETRELERKILTSESEVSDLEYEKATEALFDLKIKEGEIEKEYMKEFAQILSKRQLFMLKNAERNFSRDLMLQQLKLRSKNGLSTNN